MTEHESHPNAPKRTMLRMKWNRKLFNKVELTRQQRHFEACVEELKTLEKNKTSAASVYAFTTGMIAETQEGETQETVYLLKYMSVNDIIKGTPIKNRNRRNNERKRI